MGCEAVEFGRGYQRFGGIRLTHLQGKTIRGERHISPKHWYPFTKLRGF